MTSVAVTTDRFAAVAPVYIAVGLRAVALPSVRVESAPPSVLAAARAAISEADLVVVTSGRTLQLLWPDGPMPAVDVAVVGKSTKASVERRGGRVVITGSGGLADLVELGADAFVQSRLVFPHGVGADPTGLTALRGVSDSLLEFEVYRAVPVAPAKTAVDAVSFASPSAVEGWLLSRGLDGVMVGVIGPTTASAIPAPASFLVAPEPSHDALARVLASHLEVHA